MKKEKDLFYTDDHMGCFGGFNIDDTICRKYCILSLRCAIEYDNNSRSALLEELLTSEMSFQKIQ